MYYIKKVVKSREINTLILLILSIILYKATVIVNFTTSSKVHFVI